LFSVSLFSFSFHISIASFFFFFLSLSPSLSLSLSSRNIPQCGRTICRVYVSTSIQKKRNEIEKNKQTKHRIKFQMPTTSSPLLNQSISFCCIFFYRNLLSLTLDIIFFSHLHTRHSIPRLSTVMDFIFSLLSFVVYVCVCVCVCFCADFLLSTTISSFSLSLSLLVVSVCI